MLSIIHIQTILASSFFDGSVSLAGLAIYAVMLALVLVLMRGHIWQSLVLALPISVICMSMGILSGDLAVIMIIIIVLGLAVTAARVGLGR